MCVITDELVYRVGEWRFKDHIVRVGIPYGIDELYSSKDYPIVFNVERMIDGKMENIFDDAFAKSALDKTRLERSGTMLDLKCPERPIMDHQKIWITRINKVKAATDLENEYILKEFENTFLPKILKQRE